MEDTFKQLCNEGIKWGPGLIIALVMLFGLFWLLKGVGLKIIGAIDKPTQALMIQAQSMDKLTNSIQEYVHRDASEHQEIIILQKVIRDELKGIRNQSERIEQRIGEMNHGSQIRNS